MGGSSTFTGAGGGQTTGGSYSCGGTHEFVVVTESGEASKIWDECVEGQEVSIDLKWVGGLPRLEVVRLIDGLSIGLVPAGMSRLLECLKEGWEYDGAIIEIAGNEYQPKITVKVKGEK